MILDVQGFSSTNRRGRKAGSTEAGEASGEAAGPKSKRGRKPRRPSGADLPGSEVGLIFVAGMRSGFHFHQLGIIQLHRQASRR